MDHEAAAQVPDAVPIGAIPGRKKDQPTKDPAGFLLEDEILIVYKAALDVRLSYQEVRLHLSIDRYTPPSF